MAFVDLVIAFVVAAAALGGFMQGFFRSVCSLVGLLAGLVLAAWNYQKAAAVLLPVVRIEAAADAIAFVLIALAVMLVAAVLGILLSSTAKELGLGCLDRLIGAAFGFVQGAVLVCLFVLVAVAFFPSAQWLTEARLPRMFFGACHLSTHMSPSELAGRVRAGLNELEHNSPDWMHSGGL